MSRSGSALPTACATAKRDRCKNLTLRRVPYGSAAVLFGRVRSQLYKHRRVQGRMPSHGGRHLLWDTATMQNVQPDNMDSMPLRQSSHRSEERRVGKSVDLGGRRIIKKKK